jgi:DNA mismatch repair ATPase MutS
MTTIHVEKHGDFYNAYNRDAEDLVRSLEITLTKRDGMPMASIPAHNVEHCINVLNADGFNVCFNRPIRA